MTTMYTPDHEWINIEDHEAATVGITLHAQDALGDVVFVDLPEVGRTFAKGDVAGVVESVGGGVDEFRPGDAVFGMTGGVGGIQGTLAEFATQMASMSAVMAVATQRESR